jgi:hypothetical protein
MMGTSFLQGGGRVDHATNIIIISRNYFTVCYTEGVNQSTHCSSHSSFTIVIVAGTMVLPSLLQILLPPLPRVLPLGCRV